MQQPAENHRSGKDMLRGRDGCRMNKKPGEFDVRDGRSIGLAVGYVKIRSPLA